ncbi:hypothetical protein AMECASPLE_021198, partial [Ameca splendens]
MSSVQIKREFILQQVAPAEETFSELKEIKSEEEMGGHHRLLDFTRTPEIILHRIDHLQDHVWKEEVFSDQQLCKQERNSGLDQEEPEPWQIKEEPVHPWTEGGDMDLYLSKPEEQFVLKQEAADPFMVTPSHVVEYYIEPEPIGHQVLSQDLCKTENQDQEGHHQKDSRLNPDNELKQDDR